jgi:hypothetical protein
MTHHEARIAAALDQLVPRPADPPGAWEDLLREADAQSRRVKWSSRAAAFSSRRRLLLAAAAAIATMVIVIPALAASQDWWFLGSSAPKAESNVNVVTSGRSAGIAWSMTAYASRDKGVCVALTPHVGKGDMGAMSCGAEVRGEPGGHYWLGYSFFALGMYDFPPFVFGPVARGVDQVDVVLTDGQVIHSGTLDSPDKLQVSLKFYAVPLPRGALLKSVVARNRSGNVLERRDCGFCSHLKGHTLGPGR